MSLLFRWLKKTFTSKKVNDNSLHEVVKNVKVKDDVTSVTLNDTKSNNKALTDKQNEAMDVINNKFLNDSNKYRRRGGIVLLNTSEIHDDILFPPLVVWKKTIPEFDYICKY